MIPLHKVFMPANIEEVINPLREVLSSGWIGEGNQVLKFERCLQEYLGVEHVTALNSGTSALQLALRLCGVGIGDEVITTPMTCMATNEPIVLTGATPVWADIDPATGNIDVDGIRKKISTRTKAIMMVHWGGYPCDIEEINQLAREYGLKVIEDSAHALGSVYQDKLIGNYSDFCCFSFQAIKHITTGDGGLLVCRSEKDHKRARSLKWFGIDREQRKTNALGIAEWDIIEAGYKYHMNDIAATIGLVQLPYLATILAQRRENAAFYRADLAGLHRVQLLQEQSQDRKSSYWLFTLKVDNQTQFIDHLFRHGIAASIVHARNDSHSIFANYNNRNLPGLDHFCNHMVCIPVGPWVGERERQHVAEVIRSERW
ncbi:MAG: DegT/DnrJ/EryC1/StrS family aminotransferase [bacterium]